MTNLLLLSQKLAPNLKKKIFVDQFHTVPSTFRLSLTKIMGQVCFFLLHLPIDFGVILGYPKFRFHSLCQSKVIEEKPLGDWLDPPGSRRVKDTGVSIRYFCVTVFDIFGSRDIDSVIL